MTPGSQFHDFLYPPIPLGMKAQLNIPCLYALLVKKKYKTLNNGEVTTRESSLIS